MTIKRLAILTDFDGFINAGSNITKTVDPETGEVTLSATGELAGTIEWGDILGTLSAQADLQTALDAKADDPHTHVLANITDAGSLAAKNQVDIGDINAAGTADDTTFLRGDGSWITPNLTAPVTSVFGRTGAVGAQSSDYDAGQIDYDNATSGLTATDVQAAIDEVHGLVDPDHTHTLADITDSGVLAALAAVTAPTHFDATGTPDSTTFLRGDNTWAEPPGASGGEANTGANVGTNGVGVFDEKAGVELRFRHIASLSAAISVALDATDNDIDLDLDEAQIAHDSLGGVTASQHRTLLIDTIANRPSAATVNRFFWATDENTLYFDDGGAWHEIAPTVATAQIEDAAVTHVKYQTIGERTFLGRTLGAGSGVVTELTLTEIKDVINVFGLGGRGLVPAATTDNHSQVLWDDGWGNLPGADAAPTIVTATPVTGVFALTNSNRKYLNVLVVAEEAVDIEVPEDAAAGSRWDVHVNTGGTVTISVENDTGTLNGEASGVVTAAGSGASLSILVRANAGTAPQVVVEGETTEDSTLSGDVAANGNAITGARQHLDDLEKTASFTLALTDAEQKIIRCNHASTAIVATIPPNSAVAFPVGTLLSFVRWGAAAVSFAEGAGVTINSIGSTAPVISEQYGVASAWKQGTDTWLVYGAIEAPA